MPNISKSIPRIDAAEKISGSAKYIADYVFDGMLYAKTLRSAKAYAKIVSIKIPKMPENYFVVDKNDVPGNNRVKLVVEDQPFFAEETVNYIGEPILLFVGQDKNILDELIEKTVVEYQDLEATFTIEEAEKKYPPFKEYSFGRGDIEQAFKKAKNVFEDEYSTGYQEQAYLEPQGVIGLPPDEYGKITVYGSMQCPYYVKNALISATNFAEDKIRVIQTITGGAFGGKEDYPSLLAGHVAFAAIKTKKPVKLIFNRKEDIQFSTKRHPSLIRYKTAVDENNRITAINADVRLNGGAYSGLSVVVLQRSIIAAVGVYDVPNIKISGKLFLTNTVPTGAFRGFGAPQSFFAIEKHLDTLAAKLNLNPMDFKLLNTAKKGDKTSTSGIYRNDIKIPQMISEIEKMSSFKKKFKKYSGSTRKGIGFSVFFHGGGYTGKGEAINNSEVKLLKEGKKVKIFVSNVEMGQGASTTLSKIVAQTLKIPVKNVIFYNPDTDLTPNSGPTVASRTIMIVGGILYNAALDLKKQWNEAETIEVRKKYQQPDYVHWDQDKMEGDAYPDYSWGVNVVEIEIDELTNDIMVKKVWAVFDVGNPIDDKIVKGQIDGGIIQGLGYGSMEVMQTKDGKIMQKNFTDYIIPTALDCPRIKSKLINTPYEYGPFGAKAAGELSLVGAAPALAAAVENALARKITSIPVRPEDI